MDDKAVIEKKDHPLHHQIIEGDCISALKKIPAASIDMIFADPPYNLQLEKDLTRPNNTIVNGVTAEWDKFNSFRDYDHFTEKWLKLCRNALTGDGTIWVIGSYHNIFRIGKLLQDMGFWILNDITWRKANPMPNFKGRRFTNAHETLIWAAKNPKSHYTFNYNAMKQLNEDIQMRSDWILPICNGNSRLKDDAGKKLHPTQKPEALLYRVILASSNVGDTILDPFFGTGTTGAVATKLGRKWIGIEREKIYIEAARKRIRNIKITDMDALEITPRGKELIRVPFGYLLEHGLLKAGQNIYDPKKNNAAKIRVDGSITCNNITGSIHQIGAKIQGIDKCNGWTFWHFDQRKQFLPIDILRQQIREKLITV